MKIKAIHLMRSTQVASNQQWFSIRRYSTNKTPSQSYYHHIGKYPLVYRTIAQQFERAADKFGDNEAIVSCSERTRYTYTEAQIKVNRLAAGFYRLGLNRGDRIGIWAPNSANWYLTLLAAAKAGLVLVPINPAYQAAEMAYCLKKVGIKTIVAAEIFKSQNFYRTLCNIIPEMKVAKNGIIECSEFENLRSIIMDSENDLPGTVKFEDVMAITSNADIENLHEKSKSIQPDDPCNIQFTSGTTGRPKAALMSHFSYVNNGIHIANRTELSEKHHRICVQVPLFHAYGIVISICSALNYGSTVVLPAPGFNPEQSLRSLVDEKCTVIHGTPTMYVDLIAKQNELNLPITTAEIAVTGGAGCSPQLFRNIKKTLGLQSVKTVFGMTEVAATSFISMKNENEFQITETVGHLQDHLEAKVIDEQGNPVPFGTAGELCVRGYSTMLEYFNDPEKTKETISSDKWLKTGDRFALQEDGYGRIIGRFKDMIIRGGENIYPKEIEDFLSTHPDIIENHVFGVPDERMGEEVCVHIRMKNGKSLTPQDIQRYCKGSIAHFKIPRYIFFVNDFPKTTSGKIQKFKLRAEFVSPT